jgi:hypothetical protein
MKLINIDFETYSSLRTELNEFMVICNSYNYIPTKNDFQEIIDFILLYNSGGATLCESIDDGIVNKLYESYDLIEEGSWDTGKEFDNAVGAINTIGSFAIGSTIAGAVGVGVFIKYLFKKTKIAMSVAKEKKIMTNRIKNYKKLFDLKVEKWKLEGSDKDFPEMKIPPIK